MQSSLTVGVISFPGSNGDHDALHAFDHDLGVTTRRIDFREPALNGIDAVVLPGGFAYGDALRCGAIARFSPVMEALRTFAAAGGPVLGICNGFQVLCEAHLLPGALLRNASLRFVCRWTHVRVERTASAWTSGLDAGDVLRLPIAHGEGAYFIDDAGRSALEANGQVVLRYADADGTIRESANPNGSIANIAGICNEQGNVVGLMPHPERATNALLGGADGWRLLGSIVGAGRTSAAIA